MVGTGPVPRGTEGMVQEALAGTVPKVPSLVRQVRFPVTLALQVPLTPVWVVSAGTAAAEVAVIFGAVALGAMKSNRFQV